MPFFDATILIPKKMGVVKKIWFRVGSILSEMVIDVIELLYIELVSSSQLCK